MKFSFALAQPEDDPDLRKLLADTPMPGRITVAFEREPNYFLGCSTMGPFWQVVVARYVPSREIAGVFCRSVRAHFINGERRDLGYIGQIRIAEKYRGRWLLQQGMEFFRELDADGRAPLYWGVISDENRIARGVLVDRPRRSFPASREVARIYTLGIILRKKHGSRPAEGQIQRGSLAILPEVVAFLQKYGARKQFFPRYSESDFLTEEITRGFEIHDFLIVRQNGNIVGVLGLWDQGGYKQSVVRAYDPSLRIIQPFYNLGARVVGAQPLPDLGEHIHSAYASFICIADNDPDMFDNLLRAAYNLAAERGYAYLMLGLTTDDPLLPVARQYTHISYHSRLYLAAWGGGSVTELDERIPYIEIATL